LTGEGWGEGESYILSNTDRKSWHPAKRGTESRVLAGQNEGSVCSFSLGTTESYTKDGEQEERTEEHPAVGGIVFFGKLAEIAGEYLSNGSSAYVPACRSLGAGREGSLKTEKCLPAAGRGRSGRE